MLLNEECQAFAVDEAVLSEVKRLIGKCIPEVKSSHRAEAIARGLGFKTNSSLQSALTSGAVLELQPSRVEFERFLSSRDYDVDTMQVSLMPEAVRIASGQPWIAKDRPGSIRMEVCSGCVDMFPAEHARSCYCDACKMRPGRVYGAHHFERFFRYKVYREALLGGSVEEEFGHLCVRPGWHDLLNSKGMLSELEALRSARLEIIEGNFKSMVLSPVLDHFVRSGFVGALERLEIDRKTAVLFWEKWTDRDKFDGVHFDLKLL